MLLDGCNCNYSDLHRQEQGTDLTARIRFLNENSRPGSSDLNSPELREFVLADHVQLRLVDFFTTNTTERHRYYSISEIIVAGR